MRKCFYVDNDKEYCYWVKEISPNRSIYRISFLHENIFHDEDFQNIRDEWLDGEEEVKEQITQGLISNEGIEINVPYEDALLIVRTIINKTDHEATLAIESIYSEDIAVTIPSIIEELFVNLFVKIRIEK